MAGKYWTEEEIERARKRGEEMAAWFQANAAKCLHGCLCSLCKGDPNQQQPPFPKITVSEDL